jgi:hypothetical protein
MQSRIDPHLLAKHASDCMVPANFCGTALISTVAVPHTGFVRAPPPFSHPWPMAAPKSGEML